MVELIDTRSFSSLWYWLAVAVFWAQATRTVLGVPHDLGWRARSGGAAQADFEALARIHATRAMYYWGRGQAALVALAALLLTSLIVLALGYGYEFAQALLLIVLPAMIMGALQLRAAHLVLNGHGADAALHKLMFRFRLYAQGLGIVFVFVTAVVGLYVNTLRQVWG